MKNKNKLPFENQMTHTQTVLGWVYLPLHFLVLPLLLSAYAVYAPDGLSDVDVNLIYYTVGVAFVLVVMWSYLRRGFDTLADSLGRCALTIVAAYFIDYVLSYGVTLLLMLLEGNLENPNNAQIMDMAQVDSGVMKGIAIFMAPIVEETLFRGVVFGSIRPGSRVLAYAVSILLFSVYHVWQYAALYGLGVYLYVLQYIPVSFALAWSYERTGTIWTPIFFHMAYNALSFYVLNMMESLM